MNTETKVCDGRELLALARAAIARRFGVDQPAPPITDTLRQPGATFVTLTQNGQLRGCIGSLEAWRPLAEDVCENAVNAAFRDPRFAPLDAGLGMAGLAAQLVPAMVARGTAPEAIAAAQAMMAGVPEATYRAAVAALVAFDRRANLPHIAVPTLVVTGEHDRTAAPDVARKTAERIPGAQCHILPGAGHLLNIEQPDAFNTVLLRFLQPR